jgi:putative addiction module component (TIGR02574 family)
MAPAQLTIEKKVMKWPAAQRIALAEKLVASVGDFATPEIEAAWNMEIERRSQDIREGRVVGIPAAKVLARARKKLRRV